MEYVIRTENLDVGYDKDVVIKNVDIDALKGQTICLIGPNGAGKSTILRTLSGMLSPINGTVYIGNSPIHKIKASEKAKQMAVVLTEKLSISMTKGIEIVAMGRAVHTNFWGKLNQEDNEIIEESMKIVDAWDLRDREYNSLSDGEKQKILIARALTQQPKLIILDEPTSHLDIKHKIEVVKILNRLAHEKGLTVILALHDIDIAVKSCQTILLIKDGEISVQGKPEEIIKEGTIEKLYNIKGAAYDYLLGNVEMHNENPAKIFVLGGGGTAIPVYRLLGRMNIGIVTGILHQNDVDYRVANAMKLNIISQKSFTFIDDDILEKAKEYVKSTDILIDCGFEVGDINKKNLELVEFALENNKKVLSFRNKEEIVNIFHNKYNIENIMSLSQLSKTLQEYYK
ncbi:MAG: ABC transporter ATP-binding protein [Oscillospiraceae bacterium]